MRRIVSLWLPSFATDRLAAGGDEDGQRPCALTRTEHNQVRLAAVNPAARAAGLAPGLSLADARAMLPALATRAADPEVDRAMLVRLADWCDRYTPSVAIDDSGAGAGGLNDGAASLWLDITGCAHLFGGEAALLGDLLYRLDRRGLAARVALADTPGCAWAVARYGVETLTIVPPGGARAALRPLPVAALRLDPEVAAGLRRMGLKRVQDLLERPRAPLAARFGVALIQALDRAVGEADEPISPRRPAARHRVREVFAEPISAHGMDGGEAIRRATLRLIHALCADLDTAGQGARRLVLTLHRVDGAVQRARAGTGRPVRHPETLFRLFAEPLAKVDPGFGIELMTLDAIATDPLAPAQVGLTAGAPSALPATEDTPELAPDVLDLIDRLEMRLAPGLGRPAVRRLAPVESHWPERACRSAPPASAHRLTTAGAFTKRLWAGAPARPARLLAEPEPVEIAEPGPPHRPPAAFLWRNTRHQLAAAAGPERIAPEWWLEHASAGPNLPPSGGEGSREGGAGLPAFIPPPARDYWQVQDTNGSRLWLFRALPAGTVQPDPPERWPDRWYVHGLWG